MFWLVIFLVAVLGWSEYKHNQLVRLFRALDSIGEWSRETVIQMTTEASTKLRKALVDKVGDVVIITILAATGLTGIGMVSATIIAVDNDAVVNQFVRGPNSVRGAFPPLAGIEGVAAAGDYDPYLPAAWTDTVHYEDFTDVYVSSAFTAEAYDKGGFADPFGVMVAYECQGGVHSGYSGTGSCLAQDSVVFADQASPPWVWESHLSEDAGQGLEFGVTFADGNGSGAAANLTRVYVRYSIFYEASGTFGNTDYFWNAQSNKYSQFNDLGNGFMQGWNGATGFFWEQISPNTDGTCGDTPGQAMLYSNTWTEYAGNAGDTVSYAFTGCSNVGRGGFGKTGVWQHYFICMDFSPSAGSRIISWGMKSADEQGIAGYHDNVTWYYENAGVTGVADFDSWIWNGTFGGGDKTHDPQSIWFDDLLIMTGSSGSCVTPPSFS